MSKNTFRTFRAKSTYNKESRASSGRISYSSKSIVVPEIGTRLPSRVAEALVRERGKQPNPPYKTYQQQLETQTESLLSQLCAVLDIQRNGVTIAASSGLACSVTSFLSSLYVAISRRQETGRQWTYFISPIASLGSVVSHIAVLLLQSRKQTKFNTAAATNTVAQMVHLATELSEQKETEESTVTANALSPDIALNWACSLLAIVLTAGFSTGGWSLRELNTLLTTREKTKTLSKDLAEFVKDMVDECAGADLKTNKVVAQRYHNLLERCRVLFGYRPSTFVQNKAHYDELLATIRDIDALVGDRIDPAADKPYAAAKSLLCNHYTRLLTLKSSIDRVADFTDRQTCIGVILQGAAGVGKSYLARYICERVAAQLNYNPSVYNCKPGPNGNFFEAYSSQSFGEWNEFAASSNTKKMIEKLNEIISGDACNLEGADLAFKHQPCRLNLLVMTANKGPTDLYDFMGTDGITEQANLAFMSRVIRYDVADPKFTARNDDNLHRKSDHSHLRIHLIETEKQQSQIARLDEYRNSVLTSITVEQLIRDLVIRIAKQERNFLKLKLIPRCDDGEIKKALEEDLAKIELMLGERPVSANGTTNTVPIVVRVQGPPGCGKTLTAGIIAKRAQSLLHTTTVEINSIDDLSNPACIRSRPTVYILNDIPIEQDPSKYMAWIARTHPNSLIIFTTNVICKPVPVSCLSMRSIMQKVTLLCTGPIVDTVREIRQFGQEFVFQIPYVYESMLLQQPGLLRRIGLSGVVAHRGIIYNTYEPVPANAGLCITLPSLGSEAEMFVDTAPEPICDFGDIVANFYLSKLQRGTSPITVYQVAPAIEADVTIVVKDPLLWMERVKSKTGYVNMFLSPDTDPAGAVLVNPKVTQHLFNNCDPANWVLPNLTSVTDIEAARKPLLMRFLNCVSDITVVIKTPFSTMTYCDNVIYDAKNVPNNFSMSSGFLVVRDIVVPPIELAEMAVKPQATLGAGRLNNFSFSEIEQLIQHVRNNMNDPSLRLYTDAFLYEEHTLQCIHQYQTAHPVMRWLYHHSFELKIGASIFAILVGSVAVWKTISYYIRDDDHYVTANAKGSSFKSNPKEQADYEAKTRRYIEGLGTKYKRAEDFAKDLAREYGSSYAEKWQRRYDYARANATVVDRDVLCNLLKATTSVKDQQIATDFAIQRGIVEEFDIISQKAQTMQANAVRVEHMHVKPDTVVEQAIERVRKNMVVVQGERTSYGIGLRDNLIVTVGHGVSRDTYTAVTWSPSEQSDTTYHSLAEIVFYCHERDVAILRLTGKNIPAFRDITKMFKYGEDLTAWPAVGYFARTVPNGITYAGRCTYLGRTRPLRDDKLHGWGPNTWINYTSVQLPGSATIFKPGDCGLPLIVVENNVAKIVGIHNSIDRAGIRCMATFAPVYYDDVAHALIPDLIPMKMTANAMKLDSTDIDLPMCTLPTFENYVAAPNYQEYFQKLFPTSLWSNHPEIEVLGHCPPLKTHSRPRYGKVYDRSPKCLLDVEAIPSPTDLTSLTHAARDTLPKDIYGQPNLLLAQVKKMFNREHPIDYNSTYHDLAFRLITEEYAVRYGTNIKPCRLHTAINGIAGSALNKIEMTTSPGLYLKRKYALPTKEKLFKQHQPDSNMPSYYFAETPAGKTLENDVQTILDSFRSGHPVAIVIKDNAKVELLERQEVEEQGKIRQFCELDLAVNLVVRVLLGEFLDAQVLAYAESSAKTGFNCYTFPNSFMSKIPTDYKYECIDAKRLDKQFPFAIMRCYFQTISELCPGEEHKQMLFALCLSLYRTIHISWPDPIVYVQTGGNPSGIVATTSINCYLSDFMVAVAYAKAVTDLGLYGARCFGHYVNYVKIAALGDDLLYYVHPDLYKSMAFEQIEEVYNSYGLAIVHGKNFDEELPEFCSRAIVYDSPEYIYYSKLKQRSVLQSIFYVHKGEPHKTLNAFKTALFEATFHPIDFFQSVVHDIREQMLHLDIDPCSISFFDYDEQRRHFFQYVRGQEDSPVLTGWDPEIMYDITASIAEWEDRNMQDNVSKYYTYCAQFKHECAPTSTCTRDSISGLWCVTYRDGGFEGSSTSPQKQVAKHGAFAELFEARFGEGNSANAMLENSRKHKHAFRYTISTDEARKTKVCSVAIDDQHITTADFPLECTDDNIKKIVLNGLINGAKMALAKTSNLGQTNPFI